MAREWQHLLNHFRLGEGFALLVLIVPDRDGAAICRGELKRVLGAQGKRLSGRDAAALWLAGVMPASAADFPAWDAAWRRSLEGLNQQRNPLRHALDCPLVIVAAPWVVPLFREVAPDLWSVRTQVVWIEPERDGETIAFGETLHELGRALLAQGRAGEAEEAFRRARARSGQIEPI